MSKIILPGSEPVMSQKQQSAAIKQHEMPPCTGNPDAKCSGGPTDFMLKGYDDKHRCRVCNDLHIELVMQEAGESSPNAEPQFVAPKLDKRADSERRARMNALNDKLRRAGIRGEPTESSPAPVAEGDHVDMVSAMARDEHGTRAEGISAEERRNRILAKYGKSKPLR